MINFFLRVLIALLIPCNCINENAVSNQKALIALEFMKKRNVNEAVIFNCEQHSDNMALIRILGIQGIRINLQPQFYKGNMSYLLSTKYNHLAVIVDLKCEQIFEILPKETTDPQVRRIFEQKLYTQPSHVAFTTQEVGIEKIRKGFYAFHGGGGAYKIISDTYEEQEKCRLKEIPMFSSLDISFTTKKSSPFAEHIKQKTNWLRETGLLQLEDKRWFYHSTKCGRFFISISIQDFYPALVVLFIGIVSSIVIFLLELLHALVMIKHNVSVIPFAP